MTLYEELNALGVLIKNHTADLYCPVTPETTEIIKKYTYSWSTFVNQIEGGLWYDVFMAFDPYWDKVLEKEPVKA